MPRSPEHSPEHRGTIESAIERQLQNHARFKLLTPDDRHTLIAGLTAQAETRVGAALLPMMDAAQSARFHELMNGTTSPETWQQFWMGIPGFEHKSAEVLASFLVEIDALGT